MGDVVDINTGQTKEQEPHAQGPCLCIGCGYQWQAVTPVPVPGELQCPNCNTMRGVPFEFMAPKEGTDVWYCDCGCEVFMLIKTGAMCITCGDMTSYNDLVDTK